MSLIVLYDEPPRLDKQAANRFLRSLDPTFSRAELWTRAGGIGEGVAGIGTARLRSGDSVEFALLERPIPHDVFGTTVGVGNVSQELKARARRHRAHAVLYYVGSRPTASDQFAVLLAAAAAMGADSKASLVVNEEARSSISAQELSKLAVEEGYAGLEGLPPLLLECGFVKYNDPGSGSVWMRTRGCARHSLPDLAFRAEGHHQSQEVFELFSAILDHNIATRTRATPGDSFTLDSTVIRLRKPYPSEPWPDDANLAVLEYE